MARKASALEHLVQLVRVPSHLNRLRLDQLQVPDEFSGPPADQRYVRDEGVAGVDLRENRLHDVGGAWNARCIAINLRSLSVRHLGGGFVAGGLERVVNEPAV